MYIGTTITLAEEDPTFGDTIATASGASYTGLSSTQDGLIWTIDTITIPGMS